MRSTCRITLKGTQYTAHLYYEPVIAWAIHTTKDRKEVAIERIVPICVASGRSMSCDRNAEPEAPDCTTFRAQYGADEHGEVAGSVRFIPAEPGVRRVSVAVAGIALGFIVGIDYPGTPLDVTNEELSACAAVADRKRGSA